MALKSLNDNLALAATYFLSGVNFRASAEHFSRNLELDRDGRPTHLAAITFYFLAAHAAELFLKAALLKRGVDDSQLKQFPCGHHLATLLRDLNHHGVMVTNDTTAIVNGLSNQHQMPAASYIDFIDNGLPTFWPSVAMVFSALDELQLATRVSSHDG